MEMATGMQVIGSPFIAHSSAFTVDRFPLWAIAFHTFVIFDYPARRSTGNGER
jgi:hypothetical protein